MDIHTIIQIIHISHIIHIMIYIQVQDHVIYERQHPSKETLWNWNDSLEWKKLVVSWQLKNNCKDAWIDAQFEALKKRCLV